MSVFLPFLPSLFLLQYQFYSVLHKYQISFQLAYSTHCKKKKKKKVSDFSQHASEKTKLLKVTDALEMLLNNQLELKMSMSMALTMPMTISVILISRSLSFHRLR